MGKMNFSFTPIEAVYGGAAGYLLGTPDGPTFFRNGLDACQGARRVIDDIEKEIHKEAGTAKPQTPQTVPNKTQQPVGVR